MAPSQTRKLRSATMLGVRDPSVPSPDGRCHFFRLSGELKNMIYEYALSDPNGLLYREARNGTGRLCLPTSSEAAQQPQRSEEKPQKPRGEQCYKRRKLNDEEWTPPKRDKRIQKRTKANVLDEMNQLQYVNRQLFYETKGLEIRYNDVTFEDVPENEFSSEMHCKVFLSKCTTRQQDHLRQLHIYGSFEGRKKAEREIQMKETPGRLLAFCRLNPRATLNVHMCPLHQDDQDFLLQALIRMRAFNRSNWADFAKKFTRGNAALEAEMVASALEVVGELNLKDDKKMPDNWRCFPREKTFDAAGFKRACKRNASQAELVERTVEGGLDTWVESARGLYEKGM